jgi:ABC-2 type transport system ATP-binding protein
MAMALLHEPKILFLDEPTIGLDVLAKDRIREFLRTINRDRNVTIILTTHDLKDIEEICPRLIMINQGKVMFDNTVSHLRSTVGDERELKIEFESDPGSVAIPGATTIRDDGAIKTLRFSHEQISVMALLSELGNRYQIRDVSIQEVGIEDVLRTLYIQTGRESADESEIDTWSRHRVVTR